MAFTRRGILLGAGAASGLLVAWALTPRRFDPPLTPLEGEFAFDAWLKIAKDGVITVAVPEAELGQGITSLIPQIVAQELGADWRQIAVEPAPVSGAYANTVLAAHWSHLWMPVFPGLADAPDAVLARRFAESEGFTVTADGTSIAAHEGPARAAAAAARAMLAMAAAKRWGVAWEECEAQGGFIIHDQNRARFAELVEEAARLTPPDPPVLRAEPPGEHASSIIPGSAPAFPRLDLPAKVDGSAVFAGDVRLPDMVHAAIRHAPIADTTLSEFERDAAKRVKGMLQLVSGKTWLAAVATDWWAAERALTLIAPQFDTKNRANTEEIDAALRHALRYGKGRTIAAAGDPDSWLAGQYEHFAQYMIAPALHAPLETASATARFSGGKLELWAASQSPHAARRAAARALGISGEDVVLYPLPAGGSFDARLDNFHVIEAALIAKAVGRPVQLTWSRWQEQLAGLPRAPAAAHLAARTAPDGSLTALKVRVAMPGTTNEFGARLFGGRNVRDALGAQDEADPLTLAGAVPPYGIEHLKVQHVPVATTLPTGRQRGNGAALGCFLTETFIDELAQRSGREPLSYRMTMLGKEPKLAAVLQRAATLAEWGGGSAGTGQGLACHRMELAGREGRIAVVALARRDDRGIRVDKLTAVVDIGRVVNADIARQQIEGGLIFGMALANGVTTAYADGLPITGRLGMLGLPLLSDCPEIEVEFIESDADPFDPGELAVAVAAPAIANALFSAGGTRLHTLPLTAEQA
ncbi:molybdopterin cofactor-binding domain-containing protein [Novosphingobium sp.]|uniref:molybdopterin cofactor-binding domain-containing protein n=1 Tax=Novosphingobium sp. TaxID=1874826 RepID=UPI0035AF10C9